MEVLLFTRFPELGRVKTRLIPTLGETVTTNLHRRMTERMHKLLACGSSEPQSQWQGRICYTGGSLAMMQSWLGDALPFEEQEPGDLGQRIYSAMTASFERGNTKVVVIGSDCPDLSTKHLNEAFGALEQISLVIGPATDGGYYLLGLRDQVTPTLFENIAWGTEGVFQQTLDRAKQTAHSVAVLTSLQDVDLPSDVEIARRCGLLD
jgi:rSAM/selenodomain-associated transferase 1